QLAAAVDPREAGSLAPARQGQNGNNAFVPFPFQLVGAVGYQPVIQTLPKGANMMATAVISADRRYVRISPQPTFSGISEVNTFNFASGQSQTGLPGTGGGGFGAGGFGGGGLGGFGGMGGGGGFF
ncbi:MAG: hypothetical protein ACYSWU_02230, partial [Planctomycetota bacterium]